MKDHEFAMIAAPGLGGRYRELLPSRGHLARLETGRHDPTLSMLKRLAKALRVKVGRLVE